MGITQISLNRINQFINPDDSILIIGCQNLYNADNYGEIAAEYFKLLGHRVKDIDIYECNGCQIADLRQDWNAKPEFDIVLQHGTIEHVYGSLYTPLLNIHNSCKKGGYMIHENPMTGNWPEHGQHYFTSDFWNALAEACGYMVLENIEEVAMGNVIDGWNVSCVLEHSGGKFISKTVFNKIYNQYIKSV